ncbi:LYR motif-containing protein 4 isoform X1 [Carettochelys insculpta]|uniref:LYR motif-containing protein 4 isoform X1 n=1 Tax=Carettochelys insculpta TaxID=44489 RepID=UPI003EBFA37A
MAASSRAQVLQLYRALLRESQRFAAYGYRTYAIRRIRDAFRENKHIQDSEEIQRLLHKARTNLEIIHRQAASKNEIAPWISWEFISISFFHGQMKLPFPKNNVIIGQLYSTQKLVIESPKNRDSVII